MQFAKILSEIMDSRGITAYKMWKDTGISQSYIGKLRSGEKSPSSEYLDKIANYFNISVDRLLGRESESTEIDFDDFTYAMYNEGKELTEENKKKLLEMAKFFKEQQEKEQLK